MKVGVAGHDATDTVLPHQNRGVKIVHEVSAKIGKLVQCLCEDGFMPGGCTDYFEGRGVQQGPHELIGRMLHSKDS